MLCELHCQWCGEKFVATRAFPSFSDQKCDECATNPSPRGTRVREYIAPVWLKAAVNEGYAEEVLETRRRRYNRRRAVTSRHQAINFIAQRSKCHLFDHWGMDPDGNLVTEPYAGNCETCLADAAEIARRLNVRHTVTRPSWHAPWIAECVRITFYRPEVRR
jgi:hypothetical protein